MATNTPEWQRARRPDQIEARRSAILRAAAKLLDDSGFEATGLNAIARESGVSKPNIYRYFESREAILLVLQVEEMQSWAKAFRRRLKKLGGTADGAAIAAAFADTIATRRRFCILIGAVASVLEHNVSVETIASHKRESFSSFKTAVDALAAAYPALSSDRAFSFLAMLIMGASGAWPHCHPAPLVKEVFKRPEFEGARLDFKETMREMAAALLRGFEG